jgi:hypothetical protein
VFAHRHRSGVGDEARKDVVTRLGDAQDACEEAGARVTLQPGF